LPSEIRNPKGDEMDGGDLFSKINPWRRLNLG